MSYPNPHNPHYQQGANKKTANPTRKPDPQARPDKPDNKHLNKMNQLRFIRIRRRPPQQLNEMCMQDEETGDAVPETPTPSGKATQDSQNDYVSAADKESPRSKDNDGEDEGRDNPPSARDDEAEEHATEAEVISALSFKKISKAAEEEAPISATQAVRQVELNQARSQYVQVKELYNATKSRVEELEGKAASGAIDKSLHLSRIYLVELEATMREDEERLIAALSSAHPDVVFVPTSINTSHETQEATQRTSPVKSVPAAGKRKATNPGAEATSKRKRDVDPAIYLDIEAKESNREGRADVLGEAMSRRGRIKSRAIVTQSDDEWASGGTDGQKKSVDEVAKASRRGGREKDVEEEKFKDGEHLPEDENSIFQVEKPDLSLIITDTTPAEVAEIRQIREEIKSSQFNWGDVLTISVCNVIRSWCYDSDSTLDKPQAESLSPHLMYIRALVEDRDMMTLRLQTSPRLMQVSSIDPFVTSECLNWDLIKRSTLYPWAKKNGIFRALHVMSVRSSREVEWTSHSVVKGHILSGYSIIHNILADALRIVSFKNDHASINIRQEGEDGLAGAMVEQAKTMTWLARQCFVGEDDSGPKRGRIANATVRSLQKKFFHVLLGVNIVFESEIHNGLLMIAEERGETVRKLKSMKASQKSESVLFQLINDRNKHDSGRVKSIAGGKANKAINSAATPSQSSSANDKDKSLAAKNSRDVHDFKKECLQYLSLFLMYGTAAFFHVWPSYKDQTMAESALLINLASLVSDRRYERCGDDPHVFGARAWNRLDELMFRSLKMFITDAGTFRKDIQWSDMTRHFYTEFDVKKLASLYMLDILTETHRPGLSLGIDGQTLDHIKVKDEMVTKLNHPLSEPFRALWGPTEGPLNPVADRGASLYPEVDSQGNLTRPHNPQTQMAADQAKAKGKDKEALRSTSSLSEYEEDDGGDDKSYVD
ncbi:hypothetical protein DFH28DRAFT_939272 [Melampsora americana]|nr:hypothetical protein DFH28DRAFT_939272 [Melampsora americana]